MFFFFKNAPEQMTKIKNSNNVELISQKYPFAINALSLPKEINKKVHRTLRGFSETLMEVEPSTEKSWLSLPSNNFPARVYGNQFKATVITYAFHFANNR